MIIFGGMDSATAAGRFSELNGVIFDLDGTLIDSAYVWERVDEIFLGKRGIVMPDDYVETITPLGFHDVAKYTIERFSLAEQPEDIMAEWVDLARYEYTHNVTAIPGAEDILDFFKERGLKIALATSSTRELFLPAIDRIGIAEYFDEIVVMGEIGKNKTDPAAYEYAAAALGLPGCKCAVFEDIEDGVRSAIAAGALGIAYLGTPENDAGEIESVLSVISDIATDSYEELINFISGRGK